MTRATARSTKTQRPAILLACTLLTACAIDPPGLHGPLMAGRAQPQAVQGNPTTTTERVTRIEDTPKPPPPEKLTTVKPGTPAVDTSGEKADITVAFDQLPLPEFIQVIFGNILKQKFTVDPQVIARKDLVTFRASREQTASQIESAARLLLKSYGIAVIDLGNGFYRIAPDNSQTGYAPEILRGRALPEVPLPMRPVFQLVEMQAVRNPDVASWIRAMFANKITLAEDMSRNAVLLSGQSEDIAAALAAIQVLDQPLMKGRQSIRITPSFWSADELAKKLVDVLHAEGYSASTTTQVNTPITLLPIQSVNAIIVFNADPAVLEHVAQWARQLDKPNAANGGIGNYISYQARNTNAETLAKTVQELITGQPATPTAATATGAPAGVQAPAAPKNNRVVVNNATNTLIFQGGNENNAQILQLLNELDKPARSALIEVTVAEVTLDDNTQLGVEWALNAAGIGSPVTVGGTGGGINLGSGGATKSLVTGRQGLTIARLDSLGNVKLLLNALATNSRANVLSAPRVLARSGEEASIQVGSRIPTITAQQTSAATGSTGVIQSVQYLDTGVILKIKPIIYAGDRIDLDVSQEVSSSTTVGVAGSPIVDTRKVTTKLSLKDGSPVLLGGLISQTISRSVTGVPLLQDIPLLGQIFRTNTDGNRKTEMLILITPYIVTDDHDAQTITEAFRQRLGAWANTPRPLTNPIE